MKKFGVRNISLPDNFKYSSFNISGIHFIPIHHPSYILVYKRKQMNSYIKTFSRFARNWLKKTERHKQSDNSYNKFINSLVIFNFSNTPAGNRRIYKSREGHCNFYFKFLICFGQWATTSSNSARHFATLLVPHLTARSSVKIRFNLRRQAPGDRAPKPRPS